LPANDFNLMDRNPDRRACDLAWIPEITGLSYVRDGFAYGSNIN